MTLEIQCWQMRAPGEPLVRSRRAFDPSTLAGDQVLVEVAGCGVCHTDLGFFYDSVRTRHELPLTLGHEISGSVVEAGPESRSLVGRTVVVPAVIPCGECEPCKAGRGAICAQQFFPGNDDHGGFASHVVVPGRGLCVVDDERLAASSLDLSSLSVVADAVTTPYQAILNANLQSGDVAIFIGIGGVGTFGVQLARSMGAHVVAIDVDAARVEAISAYGVELAFVHEGDLRATKKRVQAWAKGAGHRKWGWKIFETSGHPDGQTLAYALLGYDAHLGVVGYTRDKVEVRMSNLMAFDASMRGTWGCLPEHYPAVVDAVLRGSVKLDDFIEKRPMSEINAVFESLHKHELKRRPVLIPDFD